jgi:hypothetical protein
MNVPIANAGESRRHEEFRRVPTSNILIEGRHGGNYERESRSRPVTPREQ